MEGSHQLTQEKFQDILINIYQKGKEVENIKVNELIEFIEHELRTMIITETNK